MIAASMQYEGADQIASGDIGGHMSWQEAQE
jgi:hypothetical protein